MTTPSKTEIQASKTVVFQRDPIGGVDWAFFPETTMGFCRFTNGEIHIVFNPTEPNGWFAGKVTNPKYDHAETFPEFKAKMSAMFQEVQDEQARYKTMEPEPQTQSIHIEGRRWFDKVNGNTYHSSRIQVNGEFVGIVPMEYGYGDHYLTTANELLEKKGYLPEGSSKQALWRVLEGLGIDFTYQVTDGRKKDLFTEKDL